MGHFPIVSSFPIPFQSLLETHDSVASKTYETPPPSPGLDPTFSNQPVPPDAVRMVGIRKTAGEHLVRIRGFGGGDRESPMRRETRQVGLGPGSSKGCIDLDVHDCEYTHVCTCTHIHILPWDHLQAVAIGEELSQDSEIFEWG